MAADNLESTLRLEFQRILDSKGAARTKFEIRRVTQIAIDPQTGKSSLIRTQDAAILDRAQEAGDTSEQPWVAWDSRQSPSPVETKQPQRRVPNLPLEQQAIRAKCFHPSGEFEEFQKEDLEKSIPDRFEKIVERYLGRIAVLAGSQTVTYADVNAMANRQPEKHSGVNGRAACCGSLALGVGHERSITSVINSSTGGGGDKSEVFPSNEAKEEEIEQPVSDRFINHRVKLRLRCRNAELGKEVNRCRDEQISSIHKVGINPFKGN